MTLPFTDQNERDYQREQEAREQYQHVRLVHNAAAGGEEHAGAAPFYATLFDPETNDFKRGVYRLAGDDIFSRNLLILDRLEILPAYRGNRLGLACLYRCIQQYWHGCGLVALKCFPLQFEVHTDRPTADGWRQKMEMEGLGAELRSCQLKLENYYGLLGFKKVGRTGFMILNPSHVQPGLEELGFSMTPARRGQNLA